MPILAGGVTQSAGTVQPGWNAPFNSSAIVYYLHRGYCYLVGRVGTEPPGTVPTSPVLLTGLPAEARPSAPVKITVACDPTSTDDYSVGALRLPRTYTATVDPSGTITLDTFPSLLTTTPSSGTYYHYTEHGEAPLALFTHPYALTINLGNCRWPVGAIKYTDDFAPTLAPLGSYLHADFTDSGSEWSMHGAHEPWPWPVEEQPQRVHLAGALVAALDSPGVLTMLDSFPTTGEEETGLGVGHGGSDFATFDGWPVTYSFNEVTKHYNLWLPSDVMHPAGDSPPLADHAGQVSEGDSNYTSPKSAGFYPGEISGFGRKAYRTAVGSTVKTEFHCEDPEPPHSKASFMCNTQNGTLPDLFFDVSELFSLVNPAPDWFLVKLTLEAQQDVAVPNGPDPQNAETQHKGGYPENCGCEVVENWSRNMQGVITPSWVLEDGVTPVVPLEQGEGAGKGLFPKGYLKPPASHYKGSPGIGLRDGCVASLLWKGGESATVQITFGKFRTWLARVGYQAIIFPYYEKRQYGMHKGDVLDLTNCGWQGVELRQEGAATLIGSGTRGMVRLPERNR
jgi:hypothetical protein